MRNIVPKGFCPSPGFLPSQMAGMALFNDSSTSAPGTLNVEQPTAHSVNIPYESHNGNNGSSSHGSTSASSVVINGTRCVKIKLPALVTPTSWYGKRTRYSILEYEKLLDSSNMTMSDWVKIATVKTVCGGWMGGCEAGGLTLWGVISQSLIYKDIEINYTLFDAFIILHGTDTMAYTASALSFMLEDLGKTVILTGSQIPLGELRNDAIDNLLGALTIAGHFVIPEVGLFFGNRLFRGNVKVVVAAMI